MPLKTRLHDDLTTAIKARDELRTATLRMVLSAITNEEVSEPEANWLAERINRDGRTTTNELLLLAFLKRESPCIHPALQSLVDQVTRAA